MVVKSFVSAKVEIKPSLIHGLGMFAKKRIKKGEVVFVQGGHVLTKKQLFTSGVINSYQPLGNGLYIGASNKKEEEKVKLYNNHSCQPNCGMKGEITFVAMIDIPVGAELTVDYAMIDNEPYKMKCNCQSPFCRKIVTGFDWKKKNLQKKYKGYFAKYLEEKINYK